MHSHLAIGRRGSYLLVGGYKQQYFRVSIANIELNGKLVPFLLKDWASSK
jgi:hypothetical protein